MKTTLCWVLCLISFKTFAQPYLTASSTGDTGLVGTTLFSSTSGNKILGFSILNSSSDDGTITEITITGIGTSQVSSAAILYTPPNSTERIGFSDNQSVKYADRIVFSDSEGIRAASGTTRLYLSIGVNAGANANTASANPTISIGGIISTGGTVSQSIAITSGRTYAFSPLLTASVSGGVTASQFYAGSSGNKALGFSIANNSLTSSGFAGTVKRITASGIGSAHVSEATISSFNASGTEIIHFLASGTNVGTNSIIFTQESGIAIPAGGVAQLYLMLKVKAGLNSETSSVTPLIKAGDIKTYTGAVWQGTDIAAGTHSFRAPSVATASNDGIGAPPFYAGTTGNRVLGFSINNPDPSDETITAITVSWIGSNQISAATIFSLNSSSEKITHFPISGNDIGEAVIQLPSAHGGITCPYGSNLSYLEE